MSRHSTPASVSARRIATAPISMAVVSPNRPKGCSPTPMIATSSTWLPSRQRSERECHDLVALVVRAERYDDELHLHPDSQRGGVGLGQPRLHLDLAGQLDKTDAERNEVLAGGAAVGRRGRRE